MDSYFSNLSFLIGIDDNDFYEPKTFLKVKYNNDLLKTCTLSFYLNRRLDADLDIYDTSNKPKLEDF